MYYYTEELITAKQKNQYKILLEEVGLTYEDAEIQLGVFEGDKLIAGISLDNNCIKLHRVDFDYSGLGISDLLISDIRKFAIDKGKKNLFVFTKPMYEKNFNSQGFYTVIETKDVVFLENTKRGINNYIKSLEEKKVTGDQVCGLVMNLNPITKGHEHLIKLASQQNDIVHVIIVKEDKSVFDYKTRFKLLEQVCEKYNNVIVHGGSDYVISSSTFPTYFIKSKDEVPKIYANLDVNIFGKYIAPALGINRRMVGTEPYSKTTNMYNKVLKAELIKYNVEVLEVERLKINDEIISASKVRGFMKDGNIAEALKYLPEETINFLETEEGKKIIEKVKVNTNRH